MAVSIDINYEGDLRCQATHGPSGTQLYTDAPVDNEGLGRSFSPTDLLATALGSCVMTILGIMAKRNDIDLKGTKVHVEKHMVADPLRRVGSLPVTVTFPPGLQLDDAMKTKLERAAHTCPVHQSLGEKVEAPIIFNFSE